MHLWEYKRHAWDKCVEGLEMNFHSIQRRIIRVVHRHSSLKCNKICIWFKQKSRWSHPHLHGYYRINDCMGHKGWISSYVHTYIHTLSCSTLCNPMDCSLQGSSVHGILQARILKWIVFPFSKGSSISGIEPESPALQADSCVLPNLFFLIIFWSGHQYSLFTDEEAEALRQWRASPG